MNPQSRGESPNLLHAYHDGELSGLARWRFERRLRRSPELQRELEALARVGDWVRDGHVESPGPDLWDAIALRLPAIDARRAEAASAGSALERWARTLWGRPILIYGAELSALALAVVFAFQWLTPPPPPSRVVRWLDSGPRDVMVLEDAAPDTTIIWVIGPPGKRAPRGEDGKV